MRSCLAYPKKGSTAVMREAEARLAADGAGHAPRLFRGAALPAAGAKAAFDRCVQHWPYYSFCYLNRAVLALRQGHLAIAAQEIATAEARLAGAADTEREAMLRPAKQLGFSDARLAALWGTSEGEVRAQLCA